MSSVRSAGPAAIALVALDDRLLASPQALGAIAQLGDQGIPVIPVTHRTRAEVMAFRTAAALTTPFVVEGGSGVYIPQDAPFAAIPGELDDGFYTLALGGSYVQTRAGLRVLANQVQHSLLGYGDMTIERLQKATGLSAAAAQRAKARDFSEAFILPRAVSLETLTAAAATLDFRVVAGAQTGYLLGAGVGCDRAIAALIDLYQPPDSSADTAKITTFGLGCALEDRELLAAVDRPLLVASSGPPPPQLVEHGWPIVDSWAVALAAVVP